ncbi:PIN domain-containing protein [Candidatus Woesearchaeota archaeon]|nr:PIN domain-containing protein [Candidatus Woesearchaeota archaeon]
MKFFYDTYALVEIHQGNPHYEPYKQGEVVLCQLNIIELIYHFVRSKEEAKEYLAYLSKLVVDIPSPIIWKAMQFKYEKKADDLSFADCIGYIYAQENGIKFLTGDRKFENLPGVEFVK